MDDSQYYMLLNDNCERCKNLIQILNFLEIPIISKNIENWAHENHNFSEDMIAIILCANHDIITIDYVINQNMQHNNELPVVILGSVQHIKAYPCIIDDISFPIRKNQLLPVLRHCKSTRYPNDLKSSELPHHKMGSVEAALLPLNQPFNLKEYLAETEVNLIKEALSKNDGVITRTAKFLFMRRTTLIEKMRKYRLKYASKEKDSVV